jgi:hypothetical protein
MTRRFSHIQNEAEKIRIEPPRSAWMRVEAQLGTHAADRRMRRARVLSIAASVLIIVTIGFLGAYFVNSQGGYTSDIYTQRLEPLIVDPASGTSIYDVDKVKDLTSNWKD